MRLKDIGFDNQHNSTTLKQDIQESDKLEAED